MTYIPFFKFIKILILLRFSPKYRFFRNFWGRKPKVLTFQDSHFVERVILHLFWSFCSVCFKTIFGELLNIEPILVKIGVK